MKCSCCKYEQKDAEYIHNFVDAEEVVKRGKLKGTVCVP